MLTAIIPARGGSKGVKRKNLRKVNGETLVSIAVRKCFDVADFVIVSTDDRDIEAEATLAGAMPLRRPDELSQDETSTVDVMRHIVNEYAITGEILYVQCTAPLATADDYRRCVDERNEADLAVLCHPFHGFVLDFDGECVNRQLSPPMRRQDMTYQQYVIAGSAWAFDATYLDRDFYSGVVKPIRCDGYHCDIDEEADLRKAQMLSEPLFHWMQS